MSLGALTVKIGANIAGFTKGMKKAEGKLGSFGSMASRAIPAVSTAIVGAGAAFGAFALSVGKDFQNVQASIVTATGASGESLDSLVQSATNVFKDVPVSADLAGQAIGTLNTLLGATGPTLEGLTAQVLEASKALGEDGAANADLFGKAMNQWGISAEQAGPQLDHLFKLTQDLGVGLSPLLTQMNKYGPVLNNLGLSFNEAADFMGRLEKNGIQVARVMPGLNKAMRDVAAGGGDMKTAINSAVTAIAAARTDTEALNIATKTFGAEGAQRMTVAIRDGNLSLTDLGTSLAASEGAILSNAKKTRTLSDSFTLLSNGVSAAVAPLGTILVDAIQSVIQYVQPLIDYVSQAVTAFIDWVKGNDDLQTALGSIWQSIKNVAESLWPLVEGAIAFIVKAKLIEGTVNNVAATFNVLGKTAKFLAPIFKALGKMLAWVGDKFGSLFKLIGKLPGMNALIGKLDDTTEKVKDLGNEVKKKTTPAIAKLGAQMKSGGRETDSYTKKTKAATKSLIAFNLKDSLMEQQLIDSKNAVIDARKETQAFDQAWTDGTIAEEAETIRGKIDDIETQANTSVPAVNGLIGDMSTEFINGATDSGGLASAFETLGMTSQTQMAIVVKQAEAARDAVLGSDVATDFEKKTATYKALKAQADYSKQVGKDIPADQAQMLIDLEAELNDKSTGVKPRMEGPWNDAITNISTSLTNGVQSMVGILLGTEDGSLSDAFKKLGAGLASAFVDQGMKAVNDFISDAIKALLKEGPGSLFDAFSKLGKKISGLFGSAPATPSVPSAPTPPGTPSPGSIGSAAGGAISIVGAVGSVASAVSGVISNFQMAGMNKSLDLIVKHTLQTANQLIVGVQPKLNENLPALSILVSAEGPLWTIRNDLVHFIGPKLDGIKTEVMNTTKAVNSLNISVTANNVTGQDIGKAIATELRTQGALA